MSPQSPSVPAPAQSVPGLVRRLLIVGGAEDRKDMMKVHRRFVALAGGREARVVVVPTASSFHREAGETYATLFDRLGAVSTEIVSPADRRDAHEDHWVETLDAATGIFLTGGNQLKLSQFLVGTPVGDALVRAHERGAVIGGTSAGASILSRHMISDGEEALTPRQGASKVSQGLDLVPDVILDQHFEQRGRHGRLMAMVAVSPALMGLGIDEDTAVELAEGTDADGAPVREFSVHGAGGVFLVDGSKAVSDAHEAATGAPLLLSGAVVHALPTGSLFDLEERRLVRFVEQHPQDDAVFTVRQEASEISQLERAAEHADALEDDEEALLAAAQVRRAQQRQLEEAGRR
ncbi:cyanophycinase [Kytococcus sp. Marseille-QA3725]